MGPGSGKERLAGHRTPSYSPTSSHGLPTLIVMIVVLLIIVLFCFWGAPAVRDYCKSKICCFCKRDEPRMDNGFSEEGSATPTIILLPYGRMLVVDRSVLTQLQADHTGIDFMELSANLIRAQRIQNGSTPSFLDSDATSKGISSTSIDFSPPAYEEIFGTKNADLPPSYSEVSLLFKNMKKHLSGSRESERTVTLQIREQSATFQKLRVNEGICPTSTLQWQNKISNSEPNIEVGVNISNLKKSPSLPPKSLQNNFGSDSKIENVSSAFCSNQRTCTERFKTTSRNDNGEPSSKSFEIIIEEHK